MDRPSHDRRSALLAAVAVGAFALACLQLLQPFGFNQGAHYVLVQALGDGRAQIDRYRGDTGDISYFEGHYYSNKAPGLAFVSLPAYVVLERLGLPRGVHVLSIVGVVLPSVALLLLVLWLGSRSAPLGIATAAALTLGLGTLLLPFSTMYFAHALSALVGFAAFVLLCRERARPRRSLLVAAGVVAALAVAVEYPLTIVAVVLGAYAATTRPRVRRAALYGAGVCLGSVPLLAYNWWAFGNPLHWSYDNLVTTPQGSSGLVREQDPGGLLGVSIVDPRVFVELLFGSRGLLTLTPVVALGVVGAVLLWRRGSRADAAVVTATAVLLVAANSGAWGPFGGWGPGPRYLIPALPFLAFALLAVLPRLPATTAALGLVSAAIMVTATATEPLLPNNIGRVGTEGDIVDTRRWFDHLLDGEFTNSVAAELGAGRGWLGVLPFLLLVATAAVAAAYACRPWVARDRRDLATAAVALAGWLFLARSAPSLLEADRAQDARTGILAVVLTVAVVSWVATQTATRGIRAAWPVLPLLALLVPRVGERGGTALAAAFVAASALALRELPRVSGPLRRERRADAL